jgi:hypothetical protein
MFTLAVVRPVDQNANKGFRAAGPEVDAAPSLEAKRSLSAACEQPKTAQFLRIQTSHVTGPASSSVIGRPANLRASFI